MKFVLASASFPASSGGQPSMNSHQGVPSAYQHVLQQQHTSSMPPGTQIPKGSTLESILEHFL